MIEKERIKHLNHIKESEGDYVLYWMQASQRLHYNHAFQYALLESERLSLPLVVYFGLMDHFPDAALRHYQFMVEGLLEVKSALSKKGIRFVVVHNSPEIGARKLSENAAVLVTDRGYLRIERDFRNRIKEKVSCPFIQVETNVVVPVDTVSQKEEYAAATIRRKIERLLPEFTHPMELGPYEVPMYSDALPVEEMLFENLAEILHDLDLDRGVLPVSHYFRGGYSEAKKHLKKFLEEKYSNFASLRNDPAVDVASNLSPYLHFGQISPLEIYLSLPLDLSENRASMVDELIVRRELAMNFVEHNPQYDTFGSISSFARDTLLIHKNDPRSYLYTKKELEESKTHDPYWNAAQSELVLKGKMHGYMRMYWGKKVIEWTASPEEAYDILVYLNNRYSLDGRDPNGYAGIAWCFGKHDRAWKEREIFGKVRYMNDKGLERKFSIGTYVKNVDALKQGEDSNG
ncbi:deoxyribodipyrimidine photo-lyase [Proteiniclasticum ruminis]|uniref:Deoxyribodipyrimidine photo-lyase n=1 Tax=Proteiniclasticum ruminis TaxID=398199 RepID=A0A1I5ATN9_9CLOT|nr:deoxyribodipyrimidine photo-lyase [Proteiniclasticum ruminis]SFN65807.1 Deoxyribodipyrimidine photo-lyase type II [Proteiniclasticum ruminis]